jgi:hypothetical protein
MSEPAADPIDAFVDEVFEESLNSSNPAIWTPLPGPQTQAYYSEADILFYGGAAGGGKTDLALGLSGTAHQRSVIFRREFPRMRSLIERSREIFNAQSDSHAKDSYNESLHIWRLNDGRMIEFAAMQYEKDKKDQQGRPRDLYVFDEVTEFTESQVRFSTAWNRSTIPGQRCRIVLTGNPPTDADGEWVIAFFAPWLDPTHPNPAQPGELRWFVTIDDKDIEVPDASPYEHNGEMLKPRSRTFIPAKLSDNPYYGDEYRAVLQSLPEPLRSQMLNGDFTASHSDDAWQCIPTAWVKAAQARWTPESKPDLALRALGVDVARGGADSTTLAPLYGTWFDELKVYPGAETSNGAITAHYVLNALGEADAPVYIDSIGYGASAVDHLQPLHERTIPVNNSSKSTRKDKSGKYEFANLRAESYWKLREALDPASGENIALPPSRQLRVDLCAPRYKILGAKIGLESKDEIKKRIGRSPDYGDAVVLAWMGAYRGGPLIIFEG